MTTIKAKNSGDFRKSPTFYEELFMLRAQHMISSLMTKLGMKQAELASKLGIRESAMSRLLDVDRNLTFRSFARICFALDHEVYTFAKPLQNRTLSQTIEEAQYSEHVSREFLNFEPEATGHDEVRAA